MPTDPTSQPPRPPERKVFDVMRPGRAPASATSKPVIVPRQRMAPGQEASISGIGERGVAPAEAAVPMRKIQVMSGTRGVPIPVPNDPEVPAAPATPLAPVPAAMEAVPEQEVEALADIAIEGVNNGQEVLEPALVAAQQAAPQPSMQPAAPASSMPAASSPLPAFDVARDVPLFQKDAPAAIAPGASAPSHRGAVIKTLILVAIVLLLAAAIVDVLLDAGFFVLKGVPHTNFFIR